MTRRHAHDTAHHHPSVRLVRGRWVWDCSCGGASCRTTRVARPWHDVVVEALLHAGSMAP